MKYYLKKLIVRYKTRFVAQKYFQIPNINLNNIFALTM